MIGIVIAVCVVGGVLVTFLSRDEHDPPVFGSRPDVEVAWAVEVSDLTASSGTFEPASGVTDEPVLATGTGWVVMSDASSVGAEVISLDPDTGDVQWQRELGEALCTLSPAADLLCLTRDFSTSSTFELLALDPATGDTLGDPVPLELGAVPVLLTPLGDGLLTLSYDGVLTAFGTDGRTRWQEPIGLADLDLDYATIDVAEIEGGLILHFGWIVETAAVPVGGGVQTYDCHTVAVGGDHWYCEPFSDLVTIRTIDGTQVWAGDWIDHYAVNEYERIAPVALIDDRDGAVALLDLADGTLGTAVPLPEDRDHPNLLGDDEHLGLATEHHVALLRDDGAALLWSTEVTDEYLNIAESAVLDTGSAGRLVVDGDYLWVFDLATGEVLGAYESAYGSLQEIDGAVLAFNGWMVERLDLP